VFALLSTVPRKECAICRPALCHRAVPRLASAAAHRRASCARSHSWPTLAGGSIQKIWRPNMRSEYDLIIMSNAKFQAGNRPSNAPPSLSLDTTVGAYGSTWDEASKATTLPIFKQQRVSLYLVGAGLAPAIKRFSTTYNLCNYPCEQQHRRAWMCLHITSTGS
jgi:hypothetical protein